MKHDVSSSMYEAGVRGYGYRGPHSKSVAREVEETLSSTGRRPQDGMRPLVRSIVRELRDLVLVLRVLPGLLAVVLTLKGEKAINRYHARYPKLHMAIIALFSLLALIFVVLVITIP